MKPGFVAGQPVDILDGVHEGEPGWQVAPEQNQPLRLYNPATGAYLTYIDVARFVAPQTSYRVPLRGCCMHLWDSPNWQREVDMLAQAGANAIRMDLNWRDPTGMWSNTQNKWIYTKDVIAYLKSKGMKLVVSLGQDVSKPPPSTDAERQDYAAKAASLVALYPDQIAGVEVMNEPNAGGTESPSMTPASYTALLAAAYPKMKAAASKVAVLGGSTSRADAKAQDYLKALVAAGAMKVMDGAALHPYSSAWPVATVGTAMDGPGVDAVHNITGKPVWITEFGASTVSQAVNQSYSVTEQKQQQLIVQAFVDMDARPHVACATLYNGVERGVAGPDGDSITGRWGVLHRDFQPKPGYVALMGGIRR